MNKKIFKYFSHNVIDLVFQRNGFVGTKCSLPKHYNDPFELFLGVDLDVTSDILAIYQEIVQEIPQLPTTCFSNSPLVTPMWAHYAGNHSGFVLEFDVGKIQETFSEAIVRDIEYKDSPSSNISDHLHYFASTRKPRHAVWLRQKVLSEAYFSKQTSWRYEQECRLVASEKDVEDISGNMILFIPTPCLSSIVVGKNFPSDKFNYVQSVATSNDLKLFNAAIGKSQPRPFLRSQEGYTFDHRDGNLVKVENICALCSEPVPENAELCVWCGITELDRLDAARRNPLRILDQFDLLEGYLQSVAEIARRQRK